MEGPDGKIKLEQFALICEPVNAAPDQSHWLMNDWEEGHHRKPSYEFNSLFSVGLTRGSVFFRRPRLNKTCEAVWKQTMLAVRDAEIYVIDQISANTARRITYRPYAILPIEPKPEPEPEPKQRVAAAPIPRTAVAGKLKTSQNTCLLLRHFATLRFKMLKYAGEELTKEKFLAHMCHFWEQSHFSTYEPALQGTYPPFLAVL